MLELSVLLCTHSPRSDIIAGTLDALRQQSLEMNRWELVVVDSCSSPPLEEQLDLSWHPRARIVEEPELGANAARLTAFRESHGELLVIVDDDNLLDVDYLAQALNIAQRWPQLGAWGGSITGEFEEPPPVWLAGLTENLAIREIKNEVWTNIDTCYQYLPFGAGMCLRHVVAIRYQSDVANNPLKRCLGRRGDYQVSGEDPDIACTAFDLGLGVGLFPELRMRHFMPSARLRLPQILNTVRGNAASFVLLQYLRGHRNQSPLSVPRRIQVFARHWFNASSKRQSSVASLQGQTAILRTLKQYIRGEFRGPHDFRVAYNKNVDRTFLGFPW